METWRQRTGARHVAAAVLHLIVTLVSTAPLGWRMWSRIPLGSEPVATVPWFNLWSWQWTADQLPGSWVRWWDAPIFWPIEGAYARSELQPITGLVFGALDRLLPATAAYGVIVIAALTANGLAAGALARRIGVAWRPSLVAGALAQVIPFAFDQLGVVQLLMLWPVLVALWALIGWIERPTTTNASVLGLAVATAVLTCGYHALLFVCCAGLAAPLATHGVRPTLRAWRASTSSVSGVSDGAGAAAAPSPEPTGTRADLIAALRRRIGTAAIAIGVAAVVAGPFAIAQQRRLDGVRWTDETIRIGSASWRDLAPGGSRSAGVALLALGICGAVIGRRHRFVPYLVGIVAAALLMSLGMRLSVFGLRPYGIAVDRIDALARLRSPFRATATAQVVLAVLAGIAVERWWRSGGIVARAAVLVALAVACWTADPGAGEMVALPETDQVWVDWLVEHPGGAVVMLPPAPGRGVGDFEPTAAAMLQSLVHGHPLANGYTGFFPPGQFEQRELWSSFPSADSLAELRSAGVRYAVADAAWWDSDRDATARAIGVEIVLAGPDGVLIDLDG